MSCGVIFPLLFLVIIVVFLGAILAFLLFSISRLKKRMKAIGDTPLSQVGELREGLGKVQGQILGQDEPLISPLSGTPCVYYRFKVEEQRTRVVSGGPQGGSHTHTYWHPVIDDKKAVRCSIEDQTGRVDVKLLAAEMVLDTSAHERSGMLRDAAPELKEMLWETYGYSTKGILFNKSVRYSEQLIQEGDVLFVLGDVELRKGRPPLFVKGENPFVVSDRNQAGVLTFYKWRLTLNYIGLGVVSVLGVVFSMIPIFFLLLVLFASSRKPVPSGPPPVAVNPGVANPQPLQPANPPLPQPPQPEAIKPNPPLPVRPPAVKPKPEPEKKPAPEKKPEPGRAEVPWNVQPDPVVVERAALNLKDGLPMPLLGLAVHSTSAHSPMLAVPPAGVKDKSQVQVYDLRQMKPVGRPIRGAFGTFNQKFALSPDGAYFATLVPKAARSTIEVFSSATGASVRKIEVDADPKMKVSMFDFVWDNHLLTLKHKGEFVEFAVECTYQVWDLKTGAEVTSIPYDLRFIPRWGTFTPGRRYMVMEHTRGKGDFHIVLWDLKTGKQAGDLVFQGKDELWGQASGLAFTPDGEKMALLWRIANLKQGWFRLFCFDVKTGKKLRDVKIANAGERGEYPWTRGGTPCLQWVPDGSGLLLFGHLLVDFESGAVVWKLGEEPKSEQQLVDRRFFDRDHVTTFEGGPFNRKLTILTLPRAEIDAAAKKARQAAKGEAP
ncbi:MAG TPA: hypothetical protein VH643_15115 [Gemmataceae bacterium]|jgi:hypothetical protein